VFVLALTLRLAMMSGCQSSPLYAKFWLTGGTSERLDGITIGRQRAYFFTIFQVPQNWVAVQRISFKLVSTFDVRKQVVFSLGEFRWDTNSFLLRHFLRPFAGGLALPFP
jgi:hypothetical protein